MLYSDIDFINGIKSNDEKLLKALYQHYYRMIRHYILSNSGTETDVKDVYHETLLIVIRTVQKEDFILTSSLSTFIYAISKRLWLKHLNKNKSFLSAYDSVEPAEEDFEKLLEENIQKENNIQKIQIALQQIGGNCYELLKLFYYQHVSMDTIAQKLRYTNADVAKSQKYKCLQKLKKIFFELSDTLPLNPTHYESAND